MGTKTDIIIYFIKSFVINIYVYYSFNKISNIKSNNMKIKIINLVCNIVLTCICAYIEFYINSFLSIIIICLLYGCTLGKITKKQIGYSVVTTILSYAICEICLVSSAIITFPLYKLIGINNYYLNLFIVLVVLLILLYAFFKIRRFKNGFDFLCKKLSNDFADIIVINISIAVILIACLLGTIFEGIEEIRRNLLVTFIILGIIMIIIIQKVLTMYYKQKLLEKTLQETQKELSEKEKELRNLNREKFSVSKITHEFYNRQKAMELLVKQNINTNNNIIEELTNKNILKIIKLLTEEYTEEFNAIKSLSKLDTTGICEIDNMFRYMQSECEKNNIEFKLKIIGNIYPLINNVIPKNKLETLIGDHLRDAINAVNSANTERKGIFAILGIKNNIYELSIYDTGVDFRIETLLKLGLEPVTTYKGGSGIGFITTFETLKQTKSSLIITEQLKNKENYYTKSVTIRFDGKNEYKICSYRADQIEKYSKNRQILIEKV